MIERFRSRCCGSKLGSNRNNNLLLEAGTTCTNRGFYFVSDLGRVKATANLSHIRNLKKIVDEAGPLSPSLLNGIGLDFQ